MFGRLACGIVLIVAVAGLGAGAGDPKDPKNFTPFKFTSKPKVPEFADVSDWVNSPPLTMKGLKGKVVVVHFMAFS